MENEKKKEPKILEDCYKSAQHEMSFGFVMELQTLDRLGRQ
jgi:hypothetical protein